MGMMESHVITFKTISHLKIIINWENDGYFTNVECCITLKADFYNAWNMEAFILKVKNKMRISIVKITI